MWTVSQQAYMHGLANPQEWLPPSPEFTDVASLHPMCSVVWLSDPHLQ